MSLTRRNFVKLSGLSVTLGALSACEDAVTGRIAQILGEHPDAFSPPRGDEISLATHVLNRCTIGPTNADEKRIHDRGIDAWLEEQLQPSTLIDRACDTRCMGIETIHLPAAEMYECSEQHLLYDLTRHKILRAVYSQRQLFEVMVDHWTDQFNIVAFKDDTKWLKPAEDREVVRAHALGSFRDLVRASATHAAMLIYLDGHDNKVMQPSDHPNENYARELLELHTMGVGSGYTQSDIREVARCLSGWTYHNQPFRFRAATVGFDPSRHDDSEKEVLGVNIPAGGGADDIERVLDIVCVRPETARYQAMRLCRRFISDPPPHAAVSHVAEAFMQSQGNIAATLRALFTAEEFRSPAVRGILFKRPFDFVVGALRATSAETNGRDAIMEALERMGHAPHQYPTPDGYPMEAAPWLGTLLWRWKFAIALASGQLAGTTIDASALTGNASPGFAARAWGRQPTTDERELLAGVDGVALALAAPAFMHH